MRRFARFAVTLAVFVARSFGVGEVMLVGGLALTGYGAWQVYPPAGFFIPGAIMLALVAFGVR